MVILVQSALDFKVSSSKLHAGDVLLPSRASHMLHVFWNKPLQFKCDSELFNSLNNSCLMRTRVCLDKDADASPGYPCKTC